MKIGFIGVGVIGGAVSKKLLKDGFELTICDNTETNEANLALPSAIMLVSKKDELIMRKQYAPSKGIYLTIASLWNASAKGYLKRMRAPNRRAPSATTNISV